MRLGAAAITVGTGHPSTSADPASRDTGDAFGDVLGDLAQSRLAARENTSPAASTLAAPTPAASTPAASTTGATPSAPDRQASDPSMQRADDLVEGDGAAPTRQTPTTAALLALASRASAVDASASASSTPSSKPNGLDPSALASIDDTASQGATTKQAGDQAPSTDGGPSKGSHGDVRSGSKRVASADGTVDDGTGASALAPGSPTPSPSVMAVVPPAVSQINTADSSGSDPSAGRPEQTDASAAPSGGAPRALGALEVERASDTRAAGLQSRSDMLPTTATEFAASDVPLEMVGAQSADPMVAGSIQFEAHLGFSRNAPQAATTAPASASDNRSRAVPVSDAPEDVASEDVAPTIVAAGQPTRDVSPPTARQEEGAAATPQPALTPDVSVASSIAGAGVTSLPSSSQGTSQVTQQVADGVASLAQAAVPADVGAVVAPARTMVLQLAPAGLGTVTVRLHAAGTALDVRLEASESRTAAMIEHDRSELAAALDDQSYRLQTLSVTTSEPTRSGANHAETGADTRPNDERSSGLPQGDGAGAGGSGREQARGEQRDGRRTPRPSDDPRGMRSNSSLFV